MSTIGPVRRSPRFSASASPPQFAASPSQSLPQTPLTGSMNDPNHLSVHHHDHGHRHASNASPSLSPLTRSMNETDFLSISNNTSHDNDNSHSSPLSPPMGAMGFMKAMNKPTMSESSVSQIQSPPSPAKRANDSGFSLLHSSSPLTSSAPSPNFGFESSPLESPAMLPINGQSLQTQPSSLYPPPHGSVRRGAGSRRMSSFLSSPSPVFSAPAPPRRSPRFAPNSNFLTSMSPGFFSSPNLSFSLPSPSFTPLTRAAMDGTLPVRRSPRIASVKRESSHSSPSLRSSFIPPSPFVNDSNSSATLRSMTSSPHMLNNSGSQTPLFPPLEDSAVHPNDHSPSRSNRSILRTMHSNYYGSTSSDSGNGSSHSTGINFNLNGRKRRRSSVDSKSLAVMPQFTPELTSLNPFYGNDSAGAGGGGGSVGYTLDMNGSLTDMSPSLPSLVPYNGNGISHSGDHDRPPTPASTPGSLSSSMSASSGSLSGASALNLPSATGASTGAVTGSGNGSGSSCHQCKSRRSFQNLIFCANMFLAQVKYKAAKEAHAANPSLPTPKLDKKSICRKKYCETCLLKFYGERPPTPSLRQSPQSTWICPACRDICCCAACRRQKHKHRMAAQGLTADGQPGPAAATSAGTGAITSTSGDVYHMDVEQLPQLPLSHVLALAIVHLPQWNAKFNKLSKKLKVKREDKDDNGSQSLSSTQSSVDDGNASMSEGDDDGVDKETPKRRKAVKKEKKEKKKVRRRRDTAFDGGSVKQEANEEKEPSGYDGDGNSSHMAFHPYNHHDAPSQHFSLNLHDSSSSALESGSDDDEDSRPSHSHSGAAAVGRGSLSSTLSITHPAVKSEAHDDSSSSGMDSEDDDD